MNEVKNVVKAKRQQNWVMAVLFGILLMAGVVAASQAQVPTTSITANPASVVAGASATLTWSSTNAATCAASGAWSGTRAISGSLVVTPTATSVYTLTCTAGSGSATLTWTPPTTNVDGSPLTNLARYTVFHATTIAGLEASTPIVVTAPASGTVIGALPAGPRFFGVKAVNSANVSSLMSGTASKTIVFASTAGSATITVTAPPLPSPPTGLTVSDTIAFEIRTNSVGVVVAAEIGIVPMGTACFPEARTVGTTRYNRVELDRADLYNPPKNKKLKEVWMRCGQVLTTM